MLQLLLRFLLAIHVGDLLSPLLEPYSNSFTPRPCHMRLRRRHSYRHRLR
jgi:hypothetical protein